MGRVPVKCLMTFSVYSARLTSIVVVLYYDDHLLSKEAGYTNKVQ